MSDQSWSKAKLLPQIRKRAFENRSGVYVPRVYGDVKRSHWPVCQTCHRDVDRVNVEDVGQEVVTIRAWCHGKEAVMKLEFPYNIQRRDDAHTWQHVQNAINTCSFFEPSVA